MTTRLLVIGRTGQLASALLAEAPPAGCEIVALGRDRFDLAGPEAAADLIAELAPRVVINAAAYTAVDKAESETRLAYTVNARAPAALARAAAAHGAGFIHVSTDYVFDGTKSTLWVEDDPVGPLGAYGASKLAGELLVQAAHPGAVILRTSWVYAATGHNFMRTMLRLGSSRPELKVVADQHGRPTAATTLAQAILAVVPKLLAGESVGGIYHLSDAGPVTTWHGFAEAIFAAADLHPTVHAITTAEYPTPARRPANSAMALDKFIHKFGFQPPMWQEALGQVMTKLEAAGKT